MDEVSNNTLNKVTITDFCYLIDMALENKIPWRSFGSFLMDITQSLEDSRQVMTILLEKLEALHFKLLKKEDETKLHVKKAIKLVTACKKQTSSVDKASKDDSYEIENYVHISDELDNQDSLPETNAIDDDIEVLEVIKERIDVNMYSEFNESNRSSKIDMQVGENDKEDLVIEELSTPFKEIDNKWYTFVTNDRSCDKETELPDEPKEIEGIKARGSEMHITYKNPDSTNKTSLFQCKTCQKTFSDASSFKRHGSIHTGKNEKQFECQKCKKMFPQKCALKRHERIHTGEVPYECKTCKKRFKHIHNLKSHERIHTGEKPFECKTCFKTFAQSSHLKTHERIHSGEKPYECKTCFKTFTRSSVLTIHERIHSGEVPYQCKTCNKRYGSFSSLWIHEKNHH